MSILDDNNQKKTKLVHILVASKFCTEDDRQELVVDHINKDKLDNKAINLRWVTFSENNSNRDFSSHRKGKPVSQFTCGGHLIKIWSTLKEAAVSLGLSPQRISDACKNFKTYTNFYWRYYVEYIPDEEWRSVPFPELESLWASSYGRIWRPTNGIITNGSLRGGYLCADFFETSIQKRVHR